MDFDELEILDEDNELNICPYCGNINNSPDPMVLCPDCRATFGHTFYSEL